MFLSQGDFNKSWLHLTFAELVEYLMFRKKMEIVEYVKQINISLMPIVAFTSPEMIQEQAEELEKELGKLGVEFKNEKQEEIEFLKNNLDTLLNKNKK